ncbi:MAG: right-handed parallel beta-helix repeat-containing protein [Thermoguttaceae bacterium]
MRTRFGLCLALMLWSVAASGRDIFVDNRSGDDRATGRQATNTPDQNGPVRTIAKALRLAQYGDVVVLLKTGVPYRESFSLVGSRCSGTPDQPFAIRGNGAILDGSAPIPPRAWKPYQDGLFRFQPRGMAHQQLFIDGLPVSRVIASGSSHRLPTLQPRQWCLLDGWIYFRVEPTKLPDNYNLSCCREETGITLFHVEHLLISDLTVQGFQLDGISLFNSARDVSLVNVTCRGNGRSGVTVGGASAATVRASLLGDNGMAQLLTFGHSETQVLDTFLLSNTAPGWVDQGGRVLIDGKRVEGGLDEFRPATAKGGRKS